MDTKWCGQTLVDEVLKVQNLHWRDTVKEFRCFNKLITWSDWSGWRNKKKTIIGSWYCLAHAVLCFEEGGHTFAVAHHLFLNSDRLCRREEGRNISSVCSRRLVQTSGNSTNKETNPCDRMSRNMFISFGSVRTELFRMHQLAAESEVSRSRCGRYRYAYHNRIMLRRRFWRKIGWSNRIMSRNSCSVCFQKMCIKKQEENTIGLWESDIWKAPESDENHISSTTSLVWNSFSDTRVPCCWECYYVGNRICAWIHRIIWYKYLQRLCVI
jgi:hypothetical protein